MILWKCRNIAECATFSTFQKLTAMVEFSLTGVYYVSIRWYLSDKVQRENFTYGYFNNRWCTIRKVYYQDHAGHWCTGTFKGLSLFFKESIDLLNSYKFYITQTSLDVYQVSDRVIMRKIERKRDTVFVLITKDRKYDGGPLKFQLRIYAKNGTLEKVYA